jgi:Cof subfamily protein (haloacid dehalogenase superfamily)
LEELGVKLLAVDLDGTLFYPKRRKTLISSANVQFLRDFIDEGNRVIFVTSRNREFADLTVTKIDRPIDYVCINGAQIVINNELIKDETMPKGVAASIFEDMMHYKHQPLAWFLDSRKYQNLLFDNGTTYLTQLFFKYYYKSQGVYQQSYLADNDIFKSEIGKSRVYRMLLYFGLGLKREMIAKEVNKHMREKYGDDVEASWIHTVVEIAPKDCNKAAAIKTVIKQLNIDASQVHVVGDSGNDISMFQAFYEHSYCMHHANASVRKFAKYTIKRVHHLRTHLLENKGVNHD